MATPSASRIYLTPGTSVVGIGMHGACSSDMDPELLEHRTTKDRFFAGDDRSPIVDRSSFTGLSYYPPDPALAFVVTPDPVEPEPIAVGTTTGEERTYMKIATADLSIAGRDVTLTLYDTGHHGYFLPFRDATSGVETYGAGRYLDLHDNEDGTVTIDFNYAYAPFCAYNAVYSCVLPPLDNWLDMPIRAGERITEA